MSNMETQPAEVECRTIGDDARSPSGALRVEVLRVDYLLQGVPVEAGGHRVEFWDHLSPLPAIASLVLLAACLGGLIFERRRT